MSPQLLPSFLTWVSINTNMLMTLNSSSLSLTLQPFLISTHLNLLSLFYLIGSLNYLALNPDKSDAILLGTNQRNRTLSNISHIDVAGSTVPLSDSIKLLDVALDNSLTFHKHVNYVSQSCY